MNNITYKIYLFSFILFFHLSLFAQELEKSVLSKINEYKEQAERYKSQNNIQQEASFYNKIAYLYWESEFNEEAIQYFSKSLELNKAIQNKNGMKSIYYNIGLIHSDKNEFNKALIQFDEGLKIARKINQKEGVYSGLMNKASALKNLSQYEDAIKNINEALGYAKEFNNLKMIRTCYGMLAENYEVLGDSKNTMRYFELFASVDKHIKSEQIKAIEAKTKEQIQEVQKEKKETEKSLSEKTGQLEKAKENLKKTEELSRQQQLEIEIKELAIKEKEAELRSERIIRYGTSLTIVVILLFSILVYREFRAKKKANKKLEDQNEQIKKQKQEIELQRDLANQQKKDITDSIEYARRIQTALLPPLNFIKRNLPEHFILFKPRDIVSGDFYWMMNKDNKIIIAAADCTGHGVPGAFMSMLGIAFLNEIVNKIVENKHVYSLQANEILNQLRDYIIESLHQKRENNESKDGIDMSLCIIDLEKHKLQYAGAHNPLYIIKNEELEVIKGDRMPVSVHQNDGKSFTNHEVNFSENDIIYMFSDGYYDQIGGEKNHKFMSRSFKKLLLDIHQKPMVVQKEILDQTIENWKGNNIQLDDILVIGIKLEKVKEKPKESGYEWENKTILIAEDTEMNYLFLVEALRPTNVKILRAKDGLEAISIFKKHEDIDLILMDINMPKLDGFETTRLIREIKKDVPIIAQTALNMEDAREKSRQVGCNDFILKPIQLKLFLSKLNSYLKL